MATTTTRVIRKVHHHHHQMKNNIHCHQKSQTLPPSPTHSFSSSDFEFTIFHSPCKSSTTLCPADELFYKGQLLPLHLSPRLSMVRNLLLPSSSSSSETTTSRVSTGSSNDSSRDSASSSASDLVLLAADHSCDSSRPSSVTEDNNNNNNLDYHDSFKSFKRLNNIKYSGFGNNSNSNNNLDLASKKRYFTLSRLTSVFKKDPKVQKVDVVNNSDNNHGSCGINNSVVAPGSNNSSTNKQPKRTSSTAKEVISKYLKKVKPLYEKLSQKQQQKMGGGSIVATSASIAPKISGKCTTTRSNSKDRGGGNTATYALISHSFSGNLRYPRRRGCVSSCPSSMRSSPTHSGVLCRTAGLTGSGSGSGLDGGIVTSSYGDRSSMEELQSAIQGAIAHCKNSLVQSKSSTMNFLRLTCGQPCALRDC